MPSADFCRAVRTPRDALSPDLRDTRQISRGKLDRLRRTPAGFTAAALDGYGLRGQLPARPVAPASYPVLVHRAASSLCASFRRRLAATPLRFACPSPPSGWAEDFHLQAVEHARHKDRGQATFFRPGIRKVACPLLVLRMTAVRRAATVMRPGPTSLPLHALAAGTMLSP